jgi:hypothetical protein
MVPHCDKTYYQGARAFFLLFELVIGRVHLAQLPNEPTVLSHACHDTRVGAQLTQQLFGHERVRRNRRLE